MADVPVKPSTADGLNAKKLKINNLLKIRRKRTDLLLSSFIVAPGPSILKYTSSFWAV